MSWTRFLYHLIVFTIFFSSGYSAAEHIAQDNPGECFLKNSEFNIVVGEEYSAPIRFGFMEANSAEKESTYFGMAEDSFYFGFKLSLNITDSDQSRRLAYEIKHSVPDISESLPDYGLAEKDTGTIVACNQKQFTIILPQSGNELSLALDEWDRIPPHNPGLFIEGRLVSSPSETISSKNPERVLRVSFSALADQSLAWELGRLEEQSEAPAIVVEMKKGDKTFFPDSDGNTFSYQLVHSHQMHSSHDDKNPMQARMPSHSHKKIDLLKELLEEIIREADDRFP